MDGLIRKTLTARAEDVSVPAGAWAEQRRRLQAAGLLGGRRARSGWWQSWRVGHRLELVAACVVLAGLVSLAALRGPGGVPGQPAGPDGGDAAPATVRTPQVVAEVPAEGFAENLPGHLPVAWEPDGHRLLYVGAGSGADQPGGILLLDLTLPGPPPQVAPWPARGAAWGPDGRWLAYTSSRTDPAEDFVPQTIYLQRLDGGDPVDLLPGELAVRSTSTAKQLHGWVDFTTLAYEEHMGTGIQQLFLVDTSTRKLIATPDLLATFFTWAPDGQRVAGQLWGGPPQFWVWDRSTGRFMTPTAPLPGAYQWFEAWADDGRSLLFTAWDGLPYEQTARPTLYRLDLEQGSYTKVVDNAALAAWSEEGLAYVQWGEPLTLTVAGAADLSVRWTTDLGTPAPAVWQDLPFWYRPTFAGPYLAFRTLADQWQVSLAARPEVRTLYTGAGAAWSWPADGKYVALLTNTGPEARLQVVGNPLATEGAE